MKFIPFIFLFILPIYTYGQFINDIIDPNDQNTSLIYKNTESIKGDPFLFEYFNVGSVVTSTGDVYEDMKLKYDVYNDLVLVKYPKDSENEMIIDKKLVKEFSFFDGQSDKTFSFQQIQNEGEIQFMESLYEGKTYSLFARHSKRIIQSMKSGGYNSGNLTEDKSFKYIKTFLINTGDTYEEIEPKKKSIIRTLEEHGLKEVTIKSIFKEIKFKQNNEHSLLQFFNELEKLMGK